MSQQPVNGPATGTVTSVAASATSVNLLAASVYNSSGGVRRGVIIFNDSAGTGGAILYIKFGTTASTTDFTVRIAVDNYYEMPLDGYTGRIDGIWASAAGAARITVLQ